MEVHTAWLCKFYTVLEMDVHKPDSKICEIEFISQVVHKWWAIKSAYTTWKILEMKKKKYNMISQSFTPSWVLDVVQKI